MTSIIQLVGLATGEIPHPERGMQPGAAAAAHRDDVPPNAGSAS
jgi:hypothetical protein